MFDEAPMDGEDELITQARKHFKAAYAHSAEWRKEAREDYAFAAGNQWDEADLEHLNRMGRPAITFNRTAPVLDAVRGTEVNNRQEVRYLPREMGDVGVNETLTAAAEWARDQCNAEDEESDAFGDMTICGMGWTETHFSYDYDPDGQICIDRIDPLEMWWDPSATKPNLCDGKFLFRVKDLDRADVEANWPDKLGEIRPGRGGWGDTDEDGDQPHDATNAWRYDGESNQDNERKSGKYRIVEYQWKERADTYRLHDPSSGKMVELSEKKLNKLKEVMDLQEDVHYVKQKTMRVKRAFLCGNVVLEKGPAPCEYQFTYQAMTGKRDRNTNTWQGLVRPMKDPQRWANKFFSQILHIINSNSKGGVIVEEKAVENVRKFEESWAAADSVIWTKQGAVANGAIQPKPVAQYPAGIDRMMEFAISSIRDVTGVNLEMLGLADRDQAGVLEAQRKQSGLTILATLFDSLRRYRKDQGKLLLHFIQTYISDGRLIRVADKGQQRYIPLLKDKETVTYDVIVDESPTSPNQKERTMAILSQLLPMTAKMGIPLPVEMLDFMPLPESLITAWKEKLQPSQPDPMQQQMQQLQMAEQAGKVRKLEADATKSEVEAQARMIEVQKPEMVQVEQGPTPLEQEKQIADIENVRANTFKTMIEATRPPPPPKTNGKPPGA